MVHGLLVVKPFQEYDIIPMILKRSQPRSDFHGGPLLSGPPMSGFHAITEVNTGKTIGRCQGRFFGGSFTGLLRIQTQRLHPRQSQTNPQTPQESSSRCAGIIHHIYRFRWIRDERLVEVFHLAHNPVSAGTAGSEQSIQFVLKQAHHWQGIPSWHQSISGQIVAPCVRAHNQ